MSEVTNEKLQLKKTDESSEYSYDVERIVKIFAERGYEISHTDALNAWTSYSDSMCAGWLNLGEDEYVFEEAFSYFE